MGTRVQIFVINLKHSTERLAFMRSQLGDGFERIEAVCGSNIPDFLQGQFGSCITSGEVGCYASHLVAARTIVERDLPYAVILEDDAVVEPDAWAAIEAAVDHLSVWDVICLSGAKQLPNRAIACLGSRKLVRYSRFPKVTAAYVLSRSGAEKLLVPRRRLRPVDVDIRYGWEMGLDGFGIYPPPARQASDLGSSIPRFGRQRFYWRASPLGYVSGRAREWLTYLRTPEAKTK
ncbi:glycosyltransferase family 25 protein [Hyphomicrobium sp.]|uniref:glycosyltransferase family 25 protein n=1 Tax=Hyphomicrobium sp. TaxID=82 RepID=UPI0025BF319B|nr:glycosyltransferase family 25 protein [Hyphomicrobium sp.]